MNRISSILKSEFPMHFAEFFHSVGIYAYLDCTRCTCSVLNHNHEFWIQYVCKRKYYSAFSLDFGNGRKILSAFTINLRTWKWKAHSKSYEADAIKSRETPCFCSVWCYSHTHLQKMKERISKTQQAIACKRLREKAVSAARFLQNSYTCSCTPN